MSQTSDTNSTTARRFPDTNGVETSPSGTPLRRRTGKMSKPAKGSAAILERGALPATPEKGSGKIDLPVFDPQPVAEDWDVHRLNRKDGSYFLRAKDKEYLQLSWREALKVKAGLVRLKAQEGEILSEADRLQAYVLEHRRVDFVLDGLAGHRPGAYEFQGAKVLVTKAPRIIEPVAGDFTTIQQFIVSLLPKGDDGIEQWKLFCGWLKRAIEAVRAGKQSQGQILILAGQRNDGKSRLQEQIITPALGGRSADPIPSLAAETEFNSECFGAEHLLSGDPATSVKKDERTKFKQRLKQVSVGDWQRYHEKRKTPIMLPPVWRMSISINLSPDDLSLLPPPTRDFAEKVIMLRTSRANCLPGASQEAQAKFREALARELPAFIHYLLHEFDCLLTPDLRSDRFGVRSYENPTVRAMLQEQRPEVQLMDMIDTLQPWLKSAGGHWQGKAVELEDLLENDSDTTAEFARWSKRNSVPNTLGRIASGDVEHLQGRIVHDRNNKFWFWKVYPPE